MTELPALIERVLGTLGYPGLFLLTLLENLFPPLPSELILPLAGFMVSLGRMNLGTVLLVSTAGSVLGALVLYGVGRYLGDRALRGVLRRHGRRFGLSEAGYDRAGDLFRRHSAAALFWGRFVPGVRSLIALPAGAAMVPLPLFLFWTILGALGWNSGLVLAGLLLGHNWPLVIDFVGRYEVVLLWSGPLLLLAVVSYFGWRSWRRRQAGEVGGPVVLPVLSNSRRGAGSEDVPRRS